MAGKSQKTLLDKKIEACEKFLDRFDKIKFLDMTDHVRGAYYTKVALVESFMRSMGSSIVTKNVITTLSDVYWDGYVCQDADFYYMSPDNFFCFMPNASYTPYWSTECTDCFQMFGDEHFDEPYEDDEQNKIDYAEAALDALSNDLNVFSDAIYKDDAIAMILDNIDWYFSEESRYETGLMYSKLLPKVKQFVESKKGRQLKDYSKLTKLSDCDISFVSGEEWEITSDKSPSRVIFFAYGWQNGWDSLTFDVTKADVSYGIKGALIDLYIFRLDKKYHFLPEEFKDGDLKIFPNFVA